MGFFLVVVKFGTRRAHRTRVSWRPGALRLHCDLAHGMHQMGASIGIAAKMRNDYFQL